MSKNRRVGVTSRPTTGQLMRNGGDYSPMSSSAMKTFLGFSCSDILIGLIGFFSTSGSAEAVRACLNLGTNVRTISIHSSDSKLRGHVPRVFCPSQNAPPTPHTSKCGIVESGNQTWRIYGTTFQPQPWGSAKIYPTWTSIWSRGSNAPSHLILYNQDKLRLWWAINPLRTEVYFCHQNQNAKNICNFMTLLKPHNIGTHLKGIESSFQVVPLFFKSFHFWASYITFRNFLKIPSVFKGLIGSGKKPSRHLSFWETNIVWGWMSIWCSLP
jgi:hypothetical protein